MGKHKTKEEWIIWFKKYEKNNFTWEKYYETIDFTNKRSGKLKSDNNKKEQARARFRIKYKKWKMLDNYFMIKKIETRGRKGKRNLDKIISNLTEKEKEDIIKRYLEITEKENKSKRKKEANVFNWSNTRKAYIFGLHRTSFYKKRQDRKYKFDFIKPEFINTFIKNKEIYGSRKMTIELAKKGFVVNDRTLRNYMNRWNIKTKTRVAKRKSEVKNTQVKYANLVQRNFNPIDDNIIATDVSYIPTNSLQNFCYLSIVISHKTKLIESWSFSQNNDIQLVLDTFKKLKRDNFIIHSDHGKQYSSYEVSKLIKEMNGQISMSRIGNSLDNREAEYFFSCLKGEYLNHLNTSKMDFDQVKKHITWYINWYNNKRIQKKLQWKAPTQVSAYAL